MVRQELGLTIDIHLGGGDLVFPHHENEIAQSETANGTTLAKLWMHNGVNVGGTKMSKSPATSPRSGHCSTAASRR